MAQEVKATAKYIRIAPRKVRIVMNLVRGKSVADALAILKFTPKIGADAVEKVLPLCCCKRGEQLRHGCGPTVHFLSFR